MMSKKSYELLKRLTEADAPSGREGAAAEIVRAEAERLGYEVTSDALGSVIAHKPGSGAKLMFDAHLDEIGIIASYAEDNGFIRFGAVGGLNTSELPKKRVRFLNGVTGVIGSEEESFKDKPKLSKLYIDIGAKDKADAADKVKTGDMAVFDGPFDSDGCRVVSKALDDRAGCFILLCAMERIKSSENDLWFVFSAQEEVGLRGAKTAAFSIMPDYAVAVDVTDTGDTPGCPPMAVKLGDGAAIKIMDRSVVCDTEVIERLIGTAEKNGIKYQREIMADGGTDTGAIALTGAGVKAGAVSLPVRYVHSPSELASVVDIEACAELIAAVCAEKWDR